MAATRAGKGCGACKGLVGDIVEWAAGGDVAQDASARWYVPAIPLEKPELVAEIRRRRLRSVSAVFAELAPDGEDAASKMPLASLLRMLWGRQYIDGQIDRARSTRWPSGAPARTRPPCLTRMHLHSWSR